MLWAPRVAITIRVASVSTRNRLRREGDDTEVGRPFARIEFVNGDFVKGRVARNMGRSQLGKEGGRRSSKSGGAYLASRLGGHRNYPNQTGGSLLILHQTGDRFSLIQSKRSIQRVLPVGICGDSHQVEDGGGEVFGGGRGIDWICSFGVCFSDDDAGLDPATGEENRLAGTPVIASG